MYAARFISKGSPGEKRARFFFIKKVFNLEEMVRIKKRGGQRAETERERWQEKHRQVRAENIQNSYEI